MLERLITFVEIIVLLGVGGAKILILALPTPIKKRSGY